MVDIMKIFQPLEESGLLIQVVSKTIKNEAKEQKGGVFSILLGTLGASLLENLFRGKGVKAKIPERRVVKEQLEEARIFVTTSSFA